MTTGAFDPAGRISSESYIFSGKGFYWKNGEYRCSGMTEQVMLGVGGCDMDLTELRFLKE